MPICSSHPLFPGFHQTFICITIPPTSLAGNSSMRNANHIFSRQGFTPCFNFPRAHQGNIRPASRRAAFTEQIRPHPPAFLPRDNPSKPGHPYSFPDKLLATPPILTTPAPPRPAHQRSECAIQSKEEGMWCPPRSDRLLPPPNILPPNQLPKHPNPLDTCQTLATSSISETGHKLNE